MVRSLSFPSEEETQMWTSSCTHTTLDQILKLGIAATLFKSYASLLQNLNRNTPLLPSAHQSLLHPLHSQSSMCSYPLFPLCCLHVTSQVIVGTDAISRWESTPDESPDLIRKVHRAKRPWRKSMLFLYAKSLPQVVNFCYPQNVHYYSCILRWEKRRGDV